jgi:hypothetical protein
VSQQPRQSEINVHDHITHHVANFAALIPLLSFSFNGPAILTFVSAALAIVWYCIIIGEKVYHWTRKRKTELAPPDTDD